MGERGVWDDVASGLRARRELSVIDERESASPSKSGEPLSPASDDEDANGDVQYETESEPRSQRPTNDVNEASSGSRTPRTPSTPTPHTPNPNNSDTLDSISVHSTRSRVSETAPQIDVAA